jgi:hypothetical protein
MVLLYQPTLLIHLAFIRGLDNRKTAQIGEMGFLPYLFLLSNVGLFCSGGAKSAFRGRLNILDPEPNKLSVGQYC